ncbi:MAG: hypothetical protein ABR587_13390 [Candidatus Binatia bacterium]
MRRPRWRFPITLTLSVGLALTGSACSPTRIRVPAPELPALAPADELYVLSPLRTHIRRLPPQALRLLAPHWSRVREGDRKALQATLMGTLAEARVEPFVRAHLREAAAAQPDLAAASVEWLRSPVGYEVKFAEATAASGDKSSDGAFYASVAAVRDNRAPEIRLDRVRRLAAATGALPKALNFTASVGTVVARLVNVTLADQKPLPVTSLSTIVDREKKKPEVAEAYDPVVIAALLVRCRDLDLQQIDSYIAFASTPAGRWYHDTMAAALVRGVNGASMDVEAVFNVAAHSDEDPPSVGVNLDALLVSLPSGREVRLLTFAQAGAPSQPAIVLRYETSLPLTNGAAVSREAEEVWDKVRAQLESEGAHAAVLQATGSVEGWVFPFASSRKFAWRRDKGGEWEVADIGRSPGTLQREMLWSVPP